MKAAISIIIPARNDVQALRATLDHLMTLAGIDAVEIIAALAGMRQAAEAAVAGRARLLWPKGSSRAELMNAGARCARGEIFFFLHADSLPPQGAFAEIRRCRGPWRTFGFIVWLLLLHTCRLSTARYARRWRGPAELAPGSRWSRPRAQPLREQQP